MILFLFLKVKSVFFAVCGPLTVVASPGAEHRLRTRRLSSHGSRAQPLRGMWDIPDQGTNLCPLHQQADSQPLRHQGSPKEYLFLSVVSLKNFFVYCYMFSAYHRAW